MTAHPISDLFTAVSTHVVPPGWNDAEARLRAERAEVDGLLARGESAYGFTTRLGHLDSEPAPDDADALFLEEHLVGWNFEVPASLLRLFSAAKATQASRGGTGIDVGVFRAVVQHAASNDAQPVRGAWLDSYGAADVVPASWWLLHVRRRTGLTLRPGDFIACVSGSFVSTAVAVVALAEWRSVLADYLALVPPTDPTLWSSPADDRVMQIRAALDGTSARRNVQDPIALRDPIPIVSALLDADERLERAIVARLSRSSGNPRLVAGRLVSQNSYLDFILTDAIRSAAQSAFLLLQHCQRMCEHELAAHTSPNAVQVPKIAQAIVERTRHLLSAPSFSSAQSGGVEDLYDMSLDAAVKLVLMTRFVRQSIALVKRLRAPLRDAVTIESVLWGADYEILPPKEMRASWSDALASGASGGGAAAATEW